MTIGGVLGDYWQMFSFLFTIAMLFKYAIGWIREIWNRQQDD